MASSQMNFQGKSFWIHNAVAEVWFAWFVRTTKGEPHMAAWLQAMVDDINVALGAPWVDGIVMTAFDTHLTSPERLDAFVSLMKKTNEELLAKAQTSRVVSIDRFDAASEFLVPEVQMLETLFLDSQEISEPWKIFVIGKGWVAA